MERHQFVAIVYTLVINRRWAELIEFFSLYREALSLPEVTITAGQPKDKE